MCLEGGLMAFPLNEKQLVGYRVWLNELDAEARASGTLDKCDDDIWETFDPESWSGSQVCASYQKNEMLDWLAQRMEAEDQPVEWGEVYCIHRAYVEKRFGSFENAEQEARRNYKQLRNLAKWPADWPDRISLQPVEDYLARKGKPPLTQEQRELLLSLCCEARNTGLPPYISITLRNRLNKIANPIYLQQLMGIPVLDKKELEIYKRYWRSERERLGMKPLGIQTPGWQTGQVLPQKFKINP